MSTPQVNDFATEQEDSIDCPDHNNKSTMAMRLERRRRIEELNEERRLRDELTEY